MRCSNKSLTFASAIILLVLGSLSAAHAFMGARFERGEDYVPRPRLIAPATQEVVLTGQKELVFKWSPHEGIRAMREYYDFRLYKGYEMLEKTLILKERIDPATYEFRIAAEKFVDGEVYSWSLKQVYEGSHKSDRSIASFRVIKK